MNRPKLAERTPHDGPAPLCTTRSTGAAPVHRRQADDAQTLQTASQDLIDAEATAHVGAAPYQRSNTRTTQRNGSQPR
ncbi:transposase [Frankia sp. Cj3]|uniref:transposase n=1 Tax=Frankia sp. Cj3 TaxID=2880976 RepID=UPI00351D3C29